MRNWFWSLALVCLLAGLNFEALACEARYDPNTGTAFIPCIAVDETRSYHVTLQSTGGNSFVLTGAAEHAFFNPFISSLHLVLGPRPAAVVLGWYPSSCFPPHHRPSAIRTGSHVDIRLKAQYWVFPDFGCTGALVPFAEAVNFDFLDNPTDLTYSVNGVVIVPTF
jgi:hypothetical protein